MSKNRVAVYLLLVAAYVISGKAALMLALPPGYASAVFPPAGIAVAAAFISGRATLPWIFLGSLLLNLWVGYSPTHHLDLIGTSAALMIAMASMLQAAAGGWALRRVVGYPAGFDNLRDIFNFLLLAPFICLTSATLSVAGLWALHIFDASVLASSWFTWWVGDSLGLIVLLPVVMAVAGEPRPIWRGRIKTVALPMAVVFALIVVMFLKTNQWEQDDILAKFRQTSQQSLNEIQAKLDEQATLLADMHGLFVHDANGVLTRDEFRRYTSNSLSRFPMVRAMEWAPRVEESQRAKFEAMQRKDLPGFEIRERDASGKLQRAGKRSHYYPVTYLEPLASNQAAAGFDLASSTMRRQAIATAVEGGQPVATAPIPLVQESDAQSGVLVIQSVSASGRERGIVLIVLKVKDFIEKSLPATSGDLQTRLIDEDEHSVIYDNFVTGQTEVYYESRFDFGTRHYLFQTAPSASYLKLHRGWESWTVLAMGTFGTGLLGALLLLGTGFTTRMANQVNERTRELRNSESRFRHLMQTSGDGIHLLDADGNVIDVNDKFCEMLGYTRNELLRMNVRNWDAKFSPAEVRSKLAENMSFENIFETRHRRKDGTIMDVEVSAKALDLDGHRVLWNSSRDITERKLLIAELHQSEGEYRHLIEMLPYGVIIHQDGLIRLANKAAATIFRAGTPEALVGQPPLRFVHPEYREIATARIKAAIEKGQDSGTIEEKLLRLDGSELTAEVSSISVRLNNMPASLVVFTDITQRKRYEDEIRLAASVYQNSSEGMMVTDRDSMIIAINPAFIRLTGYTFDEVAGKSPNILHSGLQTKQFYQNMWRELKAAGRWQGELWNRRKDGALYAERLSINAELDSDGNVHRYVGLFSDITDQKRKEELIWSHANFDTLTGLPNRRLFYDRLEQETKKSRRSKSSLGLLFIDLDHFKDINDTLGHAKGDMLLVEATRRIKACVREADTIARLGGDEFTVILPEYGELATIDRIVHCILAGLMKPFDLGDGDVCHISASIGITLYPEDTRNLDELLQHADQAMYAAKLGGRNGFSYFTLTMQREAQEKMALTNDLRQALARNELEVYYQPIIEARTGQIVKAEALLRWNHPIRGLISPTIFIPLAEESGLILEIGEWVFDQAIHCMESWQARMGRTIQVSVNKSPVQFVRGSQHPWLDRLVGSGLAQGSVTVEITEGLLISDSAKVREELLKFQQMGIEVSIDDFGTGFSALSYLNQFDIDYLKIDRSFVNNITQNESNKALTEAIIVMAHKLGIKTVAEGVETEEQRDLLMAFGCDYLQGYLYSKPVPAREFEKLLENADTQTMAV